jgi:hypothetical protein
MQKGKEVMVKWQILKFTVGMEMSLRGGYD